MNNTNPLELIERLNKSKKGNSVAKSYSIDIN